MPEDVVVNGGRSMIGEWAVVDNVKMGAGSDGTPASTPVLTVAS